MFNKSTSSLFCYKKKEHNYTRLQDDEINNISYKNIIDLITFKF